MPTCQHSGVGDVLFHQSQVFGVALGIGIRSDTLDYCIHAFGKILHADHKGFVIKVIDGLRGVNAGVFTELHQWDRIVDMDSTSDAQ